MSRNSLIINPHLPQHCSSRSINREWFSLPIDMMWNIFSDQLFFLHHGFNVNIHAFVLMHNHYHLIVTAPENNLGQAMRYFLLEVSRSINKFAGTINQNFGGRYFRSSLNTYNYFLHAYKYTYLNPVKANICQRVEEYKYSTLNGLLGINKIIIPLEEDTLLFDSDINETLIWLNNMPDEIYWDDVKNALTKKQFKLRKINKKPHPLELDTF